MDDLGLFVPETMLTLTVDAKENLVPYKIRAAPNFDMPT